MSEPDFNAVSSVFCPACSHEVEEHEHDCGSCTRCLDFDWEFTESAEFPISGYEGCVYVGAGDECACHFCSRFEEESMRKRTETYWRERVSLEQRTGLHGKIEDSRKEERDRIARAIVDSEAFMWLMVGANHPTAHLSVLREAYESYTGLDGGYGRYQGRFLRDL